MSAKRLELDASVVRRARSLARKAGAPVVHLVELLDWATGGPKPAAMG